MGSVVLPHLVTGWHVDQAILSEEERLVVIRFGRDWDADCMRQDEVLYRIADRVKNFAVLYVCDLDQVPDFKQMYELYDPVTLMFFFRNKHMMCDFGTGNNNKLNWVLEDKQELIDIIETIYRGAKKGRGLVVSPKGMSTIPVSLFDEIPLLNPKIKMILPLRWEDLFAALMHACACVQ
ncbi:MAG: U4/U6-U5 snRNP complex subunit dib1 [Alectoria sarmentosa]|nr:MAG: U4/U6-U5 snRNP complex subunit dib1 [Alectoria sarmentosa]